PYGDQGLLIRRDLYNNVGGYSDQPLMEDVAIVLKLRGRLIPLDAFAVTSGSKYRQKGWFRQGARNLWILFRYLTGKSPEDLARFYHR
ncbi:MAG: glycosyl transferase, partial [Tateyamaria sp.]|nr:glycosyl transferase [Tateyamaria sp.]